MKTMLAHFYRAASGAWDLVTVNAARFERVMEKASVGGAATGSEILCGVLLI